MNCSFTLYIIGNNYLLLKNYPNAQKYFKLALAQRECHQFYINLPDNFISLTVLYTDILYREADKNYIRIFTKECLLSFTLKTIEDKLPSRLFPSHPPLLMNNNYWYWNQHLHSFIDIDFTAAPALGEISYQWKSLNA